MRKITTMAVFLVTGSFSCGSNPFFGKTSQKKPSQELLPQRFGTPVPMSLADPGCQQQAGVSPLGHRQVLRFDGQEVQAIDIEFQGQSTTLGLTSRGIGGTVFGEERQEVQRLSQGNWGYEYNTQVSLLSDGNYLKLCQDFADINIDKIENVALSVLSVVEEGFRNPVLQDISPSSAAGVNGPALELSLLPMLEMIYKQDDADGTRISIASYATDNAMWSLGRVDNQIQTRLTLYPQSQEAKEQGLFGSVPLHYVPFVVAHELGHEFFYRLTPAYFQNLSDIESSTLWGENFGDRAPGYKRSLTDPRASLQLGNLSQGAITNAEVMVAISEGFADMFAYYLLPKSEQDLSKLTCLENRDPRLGDFSRNIAKQLTEKNLSIYLLQTNAPSVPGSEADGSELCPVVSFTDPHVIGAIFAHHFVSLMDQRLDAKASMQVLRRWLERLNQSLAEQYFDLGPRQLLARAAFDFLTILSKDHPFNASECQTIEKQFSALQIKCG